MRMDAICEQNDFCAVLALQGIDAEARKIGSAVAALKALSLEAEADYLSDLHSKWLKTAHSTFAEHLPGTPLDVPHPIPCPGLGLLTFALQLQAHSEFGSTWAVDLAKAIWLHAGYALRQ